MGCPAFQSPACFLAASSWPPTERAAARMPTMKEMTPEGLRVRTGLEVVASIPTG